MFLIIVLSVLPVITAYDHSFCKRKWLCLISTEINTDKAKQWFQEFIHFWHYFLAGPKVPLSTSLMNCMSPGK